MRFYKNIVIDHNGFDVYINGVGYGIHWYGQPDQIFGIINNYRKMGTIREIGIIFLWVRLFIKIDR